MAGRDIGNKRLEEMASTLALLKKDASSLQPSDLTYFGSPFIPNVLLFRSPDLFKYGNDWPKVIRHVRSLMEQINPHDPVLYLVIVDDSGMAPPNYSEFWGELNGLHQVKVLRENQINEILQQRGGFPYKGTGTQSERVWLLYSSYAPASGGQ